MKDFNLYRKNLIIRTMKKIMRPCSINEVIEYIYRDDVQKWKERDSWRFYVHLNKFPVVMEKEKMIKFTGEYTIGKTGRKEKLWRILK